MEKNLDIKTLKELRELQEKEGGISIEYDEGSEAQDEYVEIEILNPENYQHTIYAWVPLVLASQLIVQKELKLTDRYCNYTSELSSNMHKKYYSEDELKNEITEIIEKIIKEATEKYGSLATGCTYTIEYEIEQGEWNDDTEDYDKLYIPNVSFNFY